MWELEAICEPGWDAKARIYIGLDEHWVGACNRKRVSHHLVWQVCGQTHTCQTEQREGTSGNWVKSSG